MNSNDGNSCVNELCNTEILANLKVALNSGLSFYRAGDLESKGFVRQFEDAFCKYLGVTHAIATNSATSALHTALLACDILPGDPVSVPDVTFSATASCVRMAKTVPHLVDIDDYYTIKPSREKFIIPVHLHGQPADMDNLQADYVIEDCSQAIGAEYKGRKVGTIGDIGVFSFNVWKHITSGEGGILVTNNDRLAHNARLIRNHGEVCSDRLGYNYRMPELCAAVLLPQLKRLPEQLAVRQEVGGLLTEKIRDIEYLTPPGVRPDCKHSYYTYAVKVDRKIDRDKLQELLLENGIYFGKGGYRPLHHSRFHNPWRRDEFPNADDCYETVMFTDAIKNWTVKDVRNIGEILGRSIFRAQENKRGR